MNSGQLFPIEQSDMYKELTAERKAMEKFKWEESEKAGYDIGDFRTEWLWYTSKQRTWRANYRMSLTGQQPSSYL